MSLRMIAAFVWTSLLLVACWIPAGWLRVNESQVHVGISHIDKLVHGILFAGFGFLWIQAARSRKELIWVPVAGVILAVLTEFGQGLPIVGRDTDALDGLADIVGLVVGLVVGLGGAYVLNGRRLGLESGRLENEV
ncbi:VanZ family protein [Singulisphaera sp. Ch08]|uniref:VanZ family protein n=1 Tax=Singulisphaera sp. Ch08 TaxID=3120278 RepID=A0AAU7CBR0_9BACT